MKVAAFDRSAVKRWFRTRWQGPFLLQLSVYGIVGIVLAVFLASDPAGPPFRRCSCFASLMRARRA